MNDQLPTFPHTIVFGREAADFQCRGRATPRSPIGTGISEGEGKCQQYLGLISQAVELELPWDKIESYGITQVKLLDNSVKSVCTGGIYWVVPFNGSYTRSTFSILP